MVAAITVGAPVSADDPETVTIVMQEREFAPATVMLPVNHKMRLVLINNDAELHAFVPVGLLHGLSVAVSGSGAPEFRTEGFKRVIVPSGGRVELIFTPERPGTYPFFCDMPGHEMRAAIRVE